MAHPVVHFEIMGGADDELQRFYGDLFGWEVKSDNPMNYGLVPAGEEGIGGGIGPAAPGDNFVTVYIEVADLQEALDRAEAGGATTIMGPSDVPGGPKLALFSDPAGNRIGLVQAAASGAS